ncbi:TadE/TadG family type IV pilus assembly protein [Tropicibacter alexandrii]|uniref:TadE/TadG family type IV pilus assembly protein n=1 Tax=Tropicibacter alexandrii TaxID=2267683 RepID=UPI000EF51CE9|nr:TadE/TadG family type IV pilus assembly protein [Tropicibacter alexandrii]
MPKFCAKVGPQNAFRTEDDGNITIFSIFMLVLILTIAGASVDIMRFEAVRTKLQSSMDRAVLAAADLDQTGDPETVVKDYMAKSGLADTVSQVVTARSLNARTVAADANARMNTLFLNMAGMDTMTAPARSVAEEKISNVEISLVLDISGSMRFNNRMNNLKPAAQAFVNKVMTDESNGVTTLNLVPFAGQVNPGDVLFDYFRGERPKIKHENNGWGNGDQDAPGNSLCNNNAENADEGAADPACADGNAPVTERDMVGGFFPVWPGEIESVVYYFDFDGDDIYDERYILEDIPSDVSDADDFLMGTVAYIIAARPELDDPQKFLGASIKGKGAKTQYFQVKGDENGTESDIGPTKHKGKIKSWQEFDYDDIAQDHWAQFYVHPRSEELPDSADDGAEDNKTNTNMNMPSSCVEIYDAEFSTTEMPTSDDYVPHFNYWEMDEATMDWGWCPGEDMAVQYYSADRQGLVDFIGNMRMHDGTGLHYGMKYGLALLDPNNQDEVSHLIQNGLVDERFEGRPIAWNDPETEKFIVLMTDGGTTDQYRPTKPKDPRNGDTPLKDQGTDSHYTLSAKSINVSNLITQCDLAKANGVTVFTIAFETSGSAATDMRECASSPSHFFDVHGLEITDAFDSIARQINNLRLIQ